MKYYSSGMYVRLGFAVAAHADPDILLIDEALAVGDAALRLKCMKIIRDKLQCGMAIIFVSHQTAQIADICDQAVWLDQGRIRQSGSCKDVCPTYEKSRYRLSLAKIVP